jgi:hypothetical protein
MKTLKRDYHPFALQKAASDHGGCATTLAENRAALF